MAKKKVSTEEVTPEVIEEVAEETVTEKPKPQKATSKKAKADDKEATQEETEQVAEEPLTIDEEIIKKATGRKKGSEKVEAASKRKKSELYRSEHVFTEFGDEEIETDSTKLREDYLNLVESSKVGRILTGKITGYHYAGERLKSTVLAEVDFGNSTFQVMIPSYLLFDYPIDKYIEPNKIWEIEKEVGRRIGSEVRFIAVNVNEKEKTALGDRLAANSRVSYEQYVKTLRDGAPRIVNGNIVQGQVISVMGRGVLIDCLGIDVFVKKEELSWQFVGNAKDFCQVGQSLNVRIDKIEGYTTERYGNKYKMLAAEGSVRKATPDTREEMYKRFHLGGIYAVEVSYRDTPGVYCVLPGGYSILCAPPDEGETPVKGAMRKVRITNKIDDELKIFGVFVDRTNN